MTFIVGFVLVAGCTANDPPAADAPAPPATSTGAPTLGDETVPFISREIYNESFRFPNTLQGNSFSDTFQGKGNLTLLDIRLDALEDCPVTSGSGRPAIVFTGPDGASFELLVNPGSFDGLCDPRSGTTPRQASPREATLSSAPGEWRLHSQGNYTATVRLTVVERPTSCDGCGATPS